MNTNENYTNSDGAIAITDTRTSGSDENPNDKPYVIFYRAAFESTRELAHTTLHEFGHVDSFLSGNFFRNYINNGSNWNAAVHLDELYAFRYSLINGGRSPYHEQNYTHYNKSLQQTFFDRFEAARSTWKKGF
jgi:hypothetical protein